MIVADAAFQAGQIIGILILVAIIIGLARTFTRSDLSGREKILGSKSELTNEPPIHQIAGGGPAGHPALDPSAMAAPTHRLFSTFSTCPRPQRSASSAPH